MSEEYHNNSAYLQEQDGYAESLYSLPYIDTSSQSSSTPTHAQPGQQQDEQSTPTPEPSGQRKTIPKKIAQLAATHKLGDVLTIYKYKDPIIRATDVSSCLLGILMIIPFPFFGSVVGIYTSRLMYLALTGILFFLYGTIRIGAGISDTLGAWIKGVQIYLCADGILYSKRGRVRAMRWDQISTVQRIMIICDSSYVLGQYILYPDNGVPLELDADFAGFGALVAAIEKEVRLRLFATALEDHTGGKTLSFGPLIVTPQGLRVGKGQRELTWDNLGIIGRNGESIVIKEKGKTSVWDSAKISDILNLFVFLLLINYIRLVQSRKSGDPSYQAPAIEQTRSEWQNYE